MDAAQIVMMPVVTDAGMATAGMEVNVAKTTEATSSIGFGELLAQNMLAGNQQETVTADKETLQAGATDGLQEPLSGSELIPVSEINLLLASQLAAFQMISTNQQLSDLPVEETSLTDITATLGEAKQVVIVADSLLEGKLSVEQPFGTVETAHLETANPDTQSRQGEIAPKNVEAFDAAMEASLKAETSKAAAQTPVVTQSGASKEPQESQRSNPESTFSTYAGAVSVADQSVARKGGYESQPVKLEAKVSQNVATLSASVQTETDEKQQVPQTASLPSTVGTTPLANQIGTVQPQQAVSKTAEVVQAEEILSQSNNNLENQALSEVTVSKMQVKAGSQPERQVASEAQLLPQELTVGTKNSAAAVSQAFRFAQPTDVVVAASDAEGQNGLASNAEQRGSQLASKFTSSLVATTEVALPTQVTDQVIAPRSSELQLVNPQMGHQQTVKAVNELVAEPVGIVVPEQVGRQVMERLANHEIKQGNDQISFKLSPENLGNLQLNMRMDDQRLKLEIVTENREVRNALLQQADELKETLAKQNIRMESFDVTTDSNSNNSQQPRDWRQMSAEQRQQQSQYAGRAAASSGFETPVRYFAKQYQSTIDVRF